MRDIHTKKGGVKTPPFLSLDRASSKRIRTRLRIAWRDDRCARLHDDNSDVFVPRFSWGCHSVQDGLSVLRFPLNNRPWLFLFQSTYHFSYRGRTAPRRFALLQPINSSSKRPPYRFCLVPPSSRRYRLHHSRNRHHPAGMHPHG